MSAGELVGYVGALRNRLAALGVKVVELDALTNAANKLSALLDEDPAGLQLQVWKDAVREWEQARTAVLSYLGRATLGTLADVPLLSHLAGDTESLARTGLKADLEIGPVHVAVSTAMFYIEAPRIPGTALPPLPIGPFQLGAVESTIGAPGGGGPSLPGGGSLVRLPGSGTVERGWGGGISVPIPPVLVTASAILAVDKSDPSFLAVLGIQFNPPIQLSFGFSLDRIGGIVGVNRGINTEALRTAIRTGTGANALLQVRPPADPAAVASTLDQLFPRHYGSHLLGPSVRLSWLSLGSAGSLLSLDLAVVLQVPSGRVAILGVARMGIPPVLDLRLDLLGLIDPVEKLVSIDASLVDSQVLGIFEIYGDAALRMSWGSQAYVVVAVGGFFPGFNPKPAKLPALRRAGMSQSLPGSGIFMRIEGYFAVTANTIQFGGRIEAGIRMPSIRAHGFIEADAIVQLQPFRFQARIAAGFAVSAGGFNFASVQLTGQLSGPGPIVVQGTMSISVFLFKLSWRETFTIGAGPAHALPVARPILEVLKEEFRKHENLHAATTADPHVVLAPRPATPGYALVPPTGTLVVQQRIAPLGFPLDRLRGVPLPGKQGVRITSAGADVLDGFAPGTYLNLTDAELMNRAPFEDLPAGKVLTPPDPSLDSFPSAIENGTIEQIVIDTRASTMKSQGKASDVALLDFSQATAMVQAARAEPTVSDPTPVLSATREQWTVLATGEAHSSATPAHEWARTLGSVALPAADLAEPVRLFGVL